MSQTGIRFLIDSNVGRAVARALMQAGHNVLFVRDLDPRMRDETILRLAVREQRLIITMDTDFGELVYHSGQPHAGVLLLRMPDASAAEKVRVVQEVVARYGSELPQRFCVYRNGRLRIRR